METGCERFGLKLTEADHEHRVRRSNISRTIVGS
jgi:hypothetical protein